MSNKNDSIKNISDEDLMIAMKLFAAKKNHDERVKKGEIKGYKKWSEYSQEEKDKHYLMTKKHNVKIKLLAKKAEDAGLIVSDEEVNVELKKVK